MSTTQRHERGGYVFQGKLFLVAIVHFVKAFCGLLQSFFVYLCMHYALLVCTLNTRQSPLDPTGLFLCSWLYLEVIKGLHVHSYPSLVYVSCSRII